MEERNFSKKFMQEVEIKQQSPESEIILILPRQ